MTSALQVVTVPNYSEEDQIERDRLILKLRELERDYHQRAQPILDALSDIERRHLPKIYLTG